MNKLDIITTGRFWLELEFNDTCYANDIDNIMGEIVHNAWKVDDDTLDCFGENLEYIINTCTQYDWDLMHKQIKQAQMLNDIQEEFK